MYSSYCECVRNVCRSFPEKHLFMSFAHFLIVTHFELVFTLLVIVTKRWGCDQLSSAEVLRRVG